jgi:hypothetical protein
MQYMKLAQEQLEAIRQRAENATPSPWKWSGDKFGDIVVYSPERRGFHNNGGEIAELDFGSQSDAIFIAHARTDIPALLDHIAELEAELAYLNGVTESLSELLAHSRNRL